MKEKLPRKYQIYYALGQLGWSMLSGIIGTYLVFYYIPSDESNLPVLIPQIAFLGFLTIVGIITMAGRFFDAITDPFIATLSDRSHSKYGRRISFMRFSAIPFALFTVLVFWNPVDSESVLNAFVLAFTLLAFYLFLTMYVTPYFALLSELGHTPQERLNLSTYISVTWFLGFAIASQAPIIWNIFINMGLDKVTSMRIAFIVLSLIALIFLFIPVFTIDEKRYCDSVPSKLNMIESVKATFQQKEFTTFILSDFVYWIAITIFQTSLIFYITVLLGFEESVSGLVMVLLGATSFILYLPVNKIASKMGKKKLLLIGFGFFASIYFFSYFLGLVPLPKEVQIGILIIVAGIPMAIFGILPNAVISDIAEYNAKKTGIRREGMFFGTRTFVSKLGQTVSMLVVTWLLHDGANEIGLRLTTVAAAIFCFIGLLILLMYNENKINQGLIEEIIEEK